MNALLLLTALAVSDLPPAKEAPDLPVAKEVKPQAPRDDLLKTEIEKFLLTSPPVTYEELAEGLRLGNDYGNVYWFQQALLELEIAGRIRVDKLGKYYLPPAKESPDLPPAKEVKPHLPVSPNCACGCIKTGQCDCKDCDHPKLTRAGHSPTPPCPNCQCGCTETGKCTCKDCDHPALEKPKVKKEATRSQPPNKKKPDTLTYAKAYKRAIEGGDYLFVWVGQPARETEASQHTYVEVFYVEAKDFPDAQAPCLVISKAERGKLLRLADLPGNPTEEAILRVIHPPVQSAPAYPQRQAPPVRWQFVAPSSSGC